jgi:hypothetical protein
MQERAYEKVETLWPYGGFTVRAFERKLGEGKLTLTEQSLLFEAKNGSSIGFDFPNLRLIRLVDTNNVDFAYSIQGELRSVSFKVFCTFPDGTELEEIPSADDPNDLYRGSLFRAITGGIVARFLSDHTSARVEGLAKMTDEKFEIRMKDLEANLSLFPDKKQYEEDVWWDDELRKRSQEAAESEPQTWDDPNREKLFYTGTNPSMTVDNAFEKLDILCEDWVNGRISPLQRVRCVATEYKIDQRMSEIGYTDEQGGSPEVWKETAEKLVQFEKRAGLDILRFT